MDSILNSVKNALGLYEDDTSFDGELLMHINSVITILSQLGVGPDEGFVIEDADSTWSDYIKDDPKLESVKTYIYLRVRSLFDPPSNSFVMDSMQRQINELEWRLNVTAES